MEDTELHRTRMPNGEIRHMEMPKDNPSLGRIVIFTPGVGSSNGATEYTAIIGQVFTDPGNSNPYCNLYVLPPFGAAYWEGSVQEGVGPRTYRWPTRS